MKERSVWRPALIMLIAFGLRMIALNVRPLWYDEAFAMLYAEKSPGAILSGTLVQAQGAAADVHPLFYYFTLHAWMGLFGQSVVATRMLSVLFGMGTVIAAWGLARELFDDRVARWVAVFTAASPFLIAYSQETRMYALLGFWSLCALWAFVRAARTNSLRAWAAFAICGALTFYSHNLGFLTCAALGLLVVVRAALKRDRQAWRLVGKTALAGLVMSLLFLPWLVAVPSQFGKIQQAYWVPRPDLKTLVQTLIVFSFDFENAIFPSALIAPALFGAVLLLVVVIVGCVRRPPADKERERFGVWLLAAVALAPVAALFLISQWRPVYIIRGLLPAAVCYLILAAWAVARMPRVACYALRVILAALVAVVLVRDYRYDGLPRVPTELTAMLREQIKPGDVIVHSNKLTFFPVCVYDRTLPQVFIGDPPGSGSDTLARPTQEALGLFPTDLEAATVGKSRVWLIIFQQAVTEAGGVHPHLTWLGARFKSEQTFHFGDVAVVLFTQ